MNGVILRVFAVGFCFAIGHALQCYKCDIGFMSVCLTSQTTCAAGEHCFSGDGKAAGFLDVMMKGCLKTAECNKTQEVSVNTNNTVYSMTKTCCDTDLCNAAPGLPTSTMLPLALATITTVLMSKV